jgi:S1-C subfamily serine protease
MAQTSERLHSEDMDTGNNRFGALQALSNDLAAAVEKASEVTVAVNGRPQTPSSGIHWSRGVVVTTDHTLRQDEDITISLGARGNASGRELKATLAGRDPSTDIAVLRVPELDAPFADFVDASTLRPGHLVLAVGRQSTASLGVISAITGAWRTWRGGRVDHFIRADVSIYTGYSGGSLVDAGGRIAGMNTSGLTRGGGVTLPKSTIDRVVGEILSKGKVARGWLGVGMQPVRLPGGATGLMVLNLEPEGPAEKGGLLLGDILLDAAGAPLQSTEDLQAALSADRIGQPVTFRIHRGGAEIEKAVVIGERP